MIEFTYAQNCRDNLIGKYYCDIKRIEDYPPDYEIITWQKSTILIIPDTFSLNKILIIDSAICNDPVIVNLPCTYSENIDSNCFFSGRFTVFSSFGYINFENDSFYMNNRAKGVFAGYGGIYYYYYGQRISNSMINKIHYLPLNLYPNPASHKIYLRTDHVTDLKTEIINISGEVLYYNQININNDEYSLDISFLKEGFYIIKLKSNGLIRTEKLIKY